MKNWIYITAVLFLIGNKTFSQSPPTWKVNENDFQYTMTFVAFLNVDGVTLSSKSDMVGAFVDGECRGVTNLIYVASEKKYLAYLTVFANVPNEKVTFLIYNSAKNQIVTSGKTVTFSIQGHIGNVFQSFSIAEPVLDSEAELHNFLFKDVTITSYSKLEDKISISIGVNEDITKLIPVFTKSNEAKMFHGTTEVVSGENVFDFTNPIEFELLSEDQSTLTKFKVTVSFLKDTLGTIIPVYYKKDAVCYNGGMIKIVYPVEGIKAFLLKDGNEVSSLPILNGQAIFKDLEAVNYKVRIQAFEKEIKINLK